MNKKFLVYLVILGAFTLSSKGVFAGQAAGSAASTGNIGSLYINKADSPFMNAIAGNIIAGSLLPKTTIDKLIDLGKPTIKEITVDSCTIDGDKIATIDITSKLSYDDLMYDIMGNFVKINNSIKHIIGKNCIDTPEPNNIHLYKCTFNIDSEIYPSDEILISVVFITQSDTLIGVKKKLNGSDIKGCSDPSQNKDMMGPIDAEAPDNFDESTVATQPPAITNNAQPPANNDDSTSNDDAAVFDPNAQEVTAEEDDGGCSLVTSATNASIMPLLLSLLPAALVTIRRRFR